MALADLFDDPDMVAPVKEKSATNNKRIPPDEMLRAEEAKLAAANEELAQAKENLGKALRAKHIGNGNETDVSKAHSALEKASSHVILATKSLEIAREIANEFRIAEERDRSIEDWSKAVKTADDRLAACKSLSKAVDAFAKAWTEVARLNEELFAACPTKLDIDAAKMRINSLEDMVRLEMARRGVEWAHEMSPSVRISQPTFDEVMAATPGVIRGWSNQLTSWASVTEGTKQ